MRVSDAEGGQTRREARPGRRTEPMVKKEGGEDRPTMSVDTYQ